MLEELRQCKTVSSSWYGVWGKGSEYGVPHTPDFYGVWGKKTFCFRGGADGHSMDVVAVFMKVFNHF